MEMHVITKFTKPNLKEERIETMSWNRQEKNLRKIINLWSMSNTPWKL